MTKPTLERVAFRSMHFILDIQQEEDQVQGKNHMGKHAGNQVESVQTENSHMVARKLAEMMRGISSMPWNRLIEARHLVDWRHSHHWWCPKLAVSLIHLNLMLCLQPWNLNVYL